MKALNPNGTAGYWDDDSARNARLKYDLAEVTNQVAIAQAASSGPGRRVSGVSQISPIAVQVNVSGVFDPSSSQAMGKEVRNALWRHVSSARVMR
jgi:hypothetical protein